jgi:hypothetical protein
MTIRQLFAIKPNGAPGLWFTDVSRYHDRAKSQLAELRALHNRIEEDEENWPQRDVLKGSVPPGKWSLYLERNMLSDTAIVFAAMAVEGFLNLYGVARLGEKVYIDHFERLGVVPKLRQLLLLCDCVEIAKNDPLVRLLESVAQHRNELVHPKAREAGVDGTAPERWKRPVLVAAEESVTAMQSFFTQFHAAVPEAEYLLPRGWNGDI